MARPAFGEWIRDAQRRGKLILMDGAMGSELQQSGLDLEKELSHQWNLKRPEAVQVVYEDYCNAGADVLQTNTFSAHLGCMRGDGDWEKSVRAGIELARQPEWDHLYTVGSLGTAVGADDQFLAPMLQVIDALGPCDGILVETQTRVDRARILLQHLRNESAQRVGIAAKLIVSFSFSRMPRTDLCWVVETPNGEERTAEDVAGWANEHQDHLLALGVNCGTHLRIDDFVKIARDYRKQTNLPLLARPGITSTIECEFSPREFAAKVKDFADAGVTLLGGCCGTTPAHVAAVRKEIDRLGLGWQAD